MRKIISVEMAYESISNYILNFLAGRQWDKAGVKAEITSRAATLRDLWLSKDDSVNEKATGFGDREIGRTAMDSIFFLRDNLLRTTGQRLWGLTFTLYPDGKFNIEYDYSRPKGYEEDLDDTIALYEAVGRIDDLGLAADVLAEHRLLRPARTWLEAQTAQQSADWGLGTETQWNLDMDSGQLRFSFADGQVLVAPVQVAGTYNTQDGTFLWGWDHPSVPEPLRRAAKRVHKYGVEHDIERFTTRTVACTEDAAWDLTAAAAMLDGAAGAYRGDANGTLVFMTFGAPCPIKAR